MEYGKEILSVTTLALDAISRTSASKVFTKKVSIEAH